MATQPVTALTTVWTQLSINKTFEIQNKSTHTGIWLQSNAGDPGAGDVGADSHDIGPSEKWSNARTDRTWWVRAQGQDNITVVLEE